MGWYVGPAQEHYRCFRCFIPSTGREVITDTVKFLPAKVPFPQENFQERFLQITNKLAKLLHPSANKPLHFSFQQSNDIEKAFRLIADIVRNNVDQRTELSPKLPPSSRDNYTILRKVPYTPEPRVTLPSEKLKKLPPLALENMPEKSPEIEKIDKPNVPTLPIMPPFNNLFLKNIRQKVQHMFDPKGNKMSIDALLEDPITSQVWKPALENELGRLSQGFNNRVKAQDTIDFISYNEIPNDRKVTYANFICDYRPLKAEKFRVRMTIGGDWLDYPDETSSPTASLIETKLLINSVISDHKLHIEKYCSIDIKDFFLATPMVRTEYLQIHKKYFSPEFMEQYNLPDKIHNDYIYYKVKKGMYGLKQAAILAYKLLIKQLAIDGYHPIPLTNGLFKHNKRKTIFALCVDYFGIKYYSTEDLLHLQNTL